MLAKILALGLCTLILPSVKPSGLTSLIELNKNDILFEKENCLLFLFTLTAEDTKVLFMQSCKLNSTVQIGDYFKTPLPLNISSFL